MAHHYYKNHKSVVELLTTRYGFTYTGIGDNYEECFFKDGECPEYVFVHSMSCSYSMYSSKAALNTNKKHEISFRSDYENEESQNSAFVKLLAYLEEHSKKPENILLMTNQNITGYFNFLEKKRQELVKMALDKSLDRKSKEVIPAIYGNLIAYQSTLSYIISLIK